MFLFFEGITCRAVADHDSNLFLPDFPPCFRLPINIAIHLINLGCIYPTCHIVAVSVAKDTLQNMLARATIAVLTNEHKHGPLGGADERQYYGSPSDGE